MRFIFFIQRNEKELTIKKYLTLLLPFVLTIAYIIPASASELIVQNNPPSWGLDRIDQRVQAENNKYQYLYDGSGVDIYVLDSGINTSHNDFAGRIKPGVSYTSETVEDCNGHGTHVAGIAAGSTYGVAKRANIIPVKVLNCANVGSFFDVVNAINWVIDNHDSSNVAVMNLSFVTGRNDSLNDLVAKAYADNIVVVVGAGNNGADASNYSPASEPTALTVAGATIGTSSGNGVMPMSNYGSSIDLYAPSSYIVSTWTGSSTASNSKSGTSQAAPFVAGVAALAIDQYPNMSAGNIINLIINSATNNAMESVPANTVNKLVYSLLNNEIVTPTTTTSTTTSTTSTTSTTTIPESTTTTAPATTTVPSTTSTVPETTTTVALQTATTTTVVPETTTTTTVVLETTTTTSTTLVSVTTTVATTTVPPTTTSTTTTLVTIPTTTTVIQPAPSSSNNTNAGGGGGSSSSSSASNESSSSSSSSSGNSSSSTIPLATTTTSTTVFVPETTTTLASPATTTAVVTTVVPLIKRTIVCVRNNIVRRITSYNPVCPKGFVLLKKQRLISSKRK